MGITATQTQPQPTGKTQTAPGRIGILLAGLVMAAIFTLLCICAALIMCISALRIVLADTFSTLAKRYSHIQRHNYK